MNKIISRFKGYRAKIINNLLQIYFRKFIGNRKFCIISNDCWGAEVYKVLNRPFNTPFIGLMLMSPCYIKLLSNLKLYLHLPLEFKSVSQYPSMQKLNAGISFPLATLGASGIEIQFLHYRSEGIAREKWERRVKRIDWNHLFVKYDCGKDYADLESVERFSELAFSNKLVFGKADFGRKDIYVLKTYSSDALKQFKNCFLIFDPFGWLKNSPAITNKFQNLTCKMANKYL